MIHFLAEKSNFNLEGHLLAGLASGLVSHLTFSLVDCTPRKPDLLINLRTWDWGTGHSPLSPHLTRSP